MNNIEIMFHEIDTLKAENDQLRKYKQFYDHIKNHLPAGYEVQCKNLPTNLRTNNQERHSRKGSGKMTKEPYTCHHCGAPETWRKQLVTKDNLKAENESLRLRCEFYRRNNQGLRKAIEEALALPTFFRSETMADILKKALAETIAGSNPSKEDRENLGSSRKEGE